MINKTKLKKMDKGTSAIERKVHRLGRKVRLGAKIGTILIGIGLALWLVTKFNSWSLTHKIVWQSPIILRTFVYIEDVKPKVEKVKVIVTPTPTPIPKTERQIIDKTKHAEVLWKVYGLESTWGANDYCRINGKGYGGFGVLDNESKIVCYPTFEKAIKRAEYWLVKAGIDKNLVAALCQYNLGTPNLVNCAYYQKYLTL